MKDPVPDLALVLIVARTTKRQTQREAAPVIGVHVSTIVEWERDGPPLNMPISNAAKLAAYIGMPLGQLCEAIVDNHNQREKAS